MRQQRTSVHQTTIMMRLPLMLAMFYLFSTARVDALTCYCSDCGAGDQCEGDVCYAQVVLHPPSEQYERRWRCFNNNSAYLCNSSSIYHATTCCETSNRCNEGIMPQLHSGTGTASPGMGTVSPMQSEPTNALTEPATTTATPDVVPPILNPFPGGNEITTSPNSPPPPSPRLAHSCYESDLSQGDEIRLCRLESWCFSTWRRRNDGSVRLKRGCATSCEPVNRNRKVKNCCRTSLCNHELRIPLDSNNTVVPDRIRTPESPTTPPPSTLTPPPSTLTPSVLPPVIETESSVTIPAQVTRAPSFYYCYCQNDVRCHDRFCTSHIGCATQSTNINGNTVTAQICVNDGSMCLEPGTQCCQGHLCNQLETTAPTNTPQSQATTGPPSVHSPSDTRRPDLDTSPTDGTTPTTAATTTTRSYSPTTSTSAIPPTTSLASNKPSSTKELISEDPVPGGSVSTGLSIYYILTIVLCLITVIIIVGIVGLLAFLCVNHSKEKRQFLSKVCSKPSAQTTTTTV